MNDRKSLSLRKTNISFSPLLPPPPPPPLASQTPRRRLARSARGSSADPSPVWPPRRSRGRSPTTRKRIRESSLGRFVIGKKRSFIKCSIITVILLFNLDPFESLGSFLFIFFPLFCVSFYPPLFFRNCYLLFFILPSSLAQRRPCGRSARRHHCYELLSTPPSQPVDHAWSFHKVHCPFAFTLSNSP